MIAVRYPALLLCAALLHGCATPRYQTFFSYQPPTHAAGMVCVQACTGARDRCLHDCQDAYAACVQNIQPEVEARYQHALEQYAISLTQYRHELDRYHLSLALGWGSHGGWYGAGIYNPVWPYAGHSPYYPPPMPPLAPSYSTVLGSVSAQRCVRDCGCQADYDICFIDCGGRRQPEQRCIANCPAAP